MKYKLINKQTGKEHLCEKVTIDGFDYYVSDKVPQLNDAVITAVGNIHYIKEDAKDFIEYVSKLGKKVIATTNNPNIDVPKVVDEVERLAFDYYEQVKKDYYTTGQTVKLPKSSKEFTAMADGFIEGYNKAKETHEEDMRKFGKFCIENNVCEEENRYYQDWELLKLWKEQQPKIVYYG